MCETRFQVDRGSGSIPDYLTSNQKTALTKKKYNQGASYDPNNKPDPNYPHCYEPPRPHSRNPPLYFT